MARQTLTVQLMHAQQRIAQLEAECNELREWHTAALETIEQLKTQQPSRPAVPAWRETSAWRKAASKAFFAANPGVTSVTDAQLREFSHV